MPDPLFGPEIRLMLADEDTVGLRSLCEELHPATIVEALDEFTQEEIWSIITPADIRIQAAIFEYLPLPRQILMIEAARPQFGKLIGKMSHDDRVELLRRVPTKVRESLLRLVDDADRKDIATLVELQENTVGALMTTDYAWLPPGMTAVEAIDQLRQQAPDRETIYYIYVLDEAKKRADVSLAPRRLLGVISLRDLILAPRHAVVRDLMSEEVVSLNFTDESAKAGQLLARYDFIAVPVVDEHGGMLGIVTHDDVIDILTEEATEDLQRQAGVSPIEGNYIEAPFLTVWIGRGKWLALLFIMQTLTINAMEHYQDQMATLVFLTFFIPLCNSVGGNAGSQAATLITRSLSLGQVKVGDWFHVLRREVLMGMALAVALGLFALVRTYLYSPGVPLEYVKPLAVTASLSVVCICLWGTLIGSMLPLFIKWRGGDPALMSSPFIATLSDVSGIVIFFSIAKVLLF